MKIDPDPTGVARPELLQEQVDRIVALWESSFPKPSWWGKIKGAWVGAVRFLIASVDYFVRTIDDLLEGGPEKKATVMESLSKVYDSIVPNLLPIFLRPFNKSIKKFVIDIMASLLIDFIVSKYRKGDWPDNEPQPEEPVTDDPDSEKKDLAGSILIFG